MRTIFKRRRAKYSAVEGLEPVEVDGVKLWIFADPLRMPTKRVFQYFNGLDQVRLGVVRDDLEAFVASSRAQFNLGNFSAAAGLLEHLAAFLDLYAVERNLVALGSSFILLDGESLDNPSPKEYEAKLAAVQSSEDVRAFFLSKANGSLTSSDRRRSDFNILEYLNNPTVKKADLTFSTLIRSFDPRPK